MIRGNPIGSQIIIGSFPSGCARDPRPSPGFAALYFSCAQGVIGGAVRPSEELTPRASRPHQTPERSRGSKATEGCAAALEAGGGEVVCASARSAHASAITSGLQMTKNRLLT